MKTNKGKKGTSALRESCVGVKKDLAFAVGEEVLACWQDGLYYLAVVQSIDEEKSKCYVSFQDNSLYWISFRHIRTTPQDDDISCILCGERDSKNHDEIVICDRCNHGYHQHCHTPAIDDESIKELGQWFCRICVFSNAARSGGALKSGPEAEALMSMKQVLPYDINSLKWATHHKSNADETYCYCGGPGLWYYKMIKCYDCKQWFHEACLQCLDFPLLLGDRFYYFVCAVCTKEKEYLKRIQLTWADIATLVMYNLTLKCDKKSFSLNEIENFVKSNWDALQTLNLHPTTLKERMKKIVEVFTHDKKKFRRHTYNDTVFWSLIVCAAPFPSKSSCFNEHSLRTNSEIAHGLLGSNGNYLSEIPGNSSKASQSGYKWSRAGVYNRGGATIDTPDEITSPQTPLFPSPSMFKYFLPSSARRDLETGNSLSPAFSSGFHGDSTDSDGCPRVGDKRGRVGEGNSSDGEEPVEKRFLDYMQRLNNDITSYQGLRGRLACGEECTVHGRRLVKGGRTEYLVEWSGTTPKD